MPEQNAPSSISTDPGSNSEAVLRDALVGDIAEIQAIYGHYVLNGLASFEIDPPDIEEMTNRWRLVQEKKLPFLVADVNGAVGGYAYASSFRPRPAYANTVEDSVYVSPAYLGRGIGKLLLDALINNCVELGYRQMIAVIGGSGNMPSINLHLKCGFERAGLLPSTGYKLDGWVDSVLMQRSLGNGDKTPPNLIDQS